MVYGQSVKPHGELQWGSKNEALWNRLLVTLTKVDYFFVKKPLGMDIPSVT